VYTDDVAYVPLNSTKLSLHHKDSKDEFNGSDEMYEVVNVPADINPDNAKPVGDRNQETEANSNVERNQSNGCCQIM